MTTWACTYAERTFLFNGAVDANHGFTPFGHGTHDLGMALDLGVRYYISVTKPGSEPGTKDGNQYDSSQSQPNLAVERNKLADQSAYDNRQWNLANALYLPGLLPEGTSDRGKNHQQSALRDFLSLYAVTRQDTITGNGTWDDLVIAGDRNTAEEAQIRAALFGDGGGNGGLISKVLIGGTGSQNPYADMREVLRRGGIPAENRDPHHNHFHVYLRPPAALPIGGRHLMANESDSITVGAGEAEAVLQAQGQALLQQLQSYVEAGDEIMFVVDMPVLPATAVQVELAQAAVSSGAAFEKSFKGCQDVGNTAFYTDSAFNEFPVLPIVLEHLGYKWDGVKGAYNVPPAIRATIRSGIFEAPSHGRVTLVDQKHHVYAYEANKGYLGKDRVVFWVEVQGRRFKIIQNLAVVRGINENSPPVCTKMKFSAIPPVALDFAQLNNGALGQTSASTITLDTTAAGHDWLIDATPDLNEEFLATSNLNEWIARPGSAAEGRMDMLSVLLHEYGHALGLEHSADGHDLMAATLSPGIRRLPSPEELALLRGLPTTADVPLPYEPFSPGAVDAALERRLAAVRPVHDQARVAIVGREKFFSLFIGRRALRSGNGVAVQQRCVIEQFAGIVKHFA